MKKILVLLLSFICVVGCSSSAPKKPVGGEGGGGFLVPKSCGDRWVCSDDPLCTNDHYKFLCEKWESPSLTDDGGQG